MPGLTRTRGGQSGLVRHGFPPFLPGRTRTHPFRGVRLSGQWRIPDNRHFSSANRHGCGASVLGPAASGARSRDQ